MNRKLFVLAVVAMVSGLFAATAAADTTATVTGVNWHAQQAALGNTGPVAGAYARLVRDDNGVSYLFRSRNMTPGNAYTLWVVVVDNPSACDPAGCTPTDILLNPATESQVLYGTGVVAGPTGESNLTGSLSEGPLAGWFPGRALTDSHGAEIHLVVNDHGQALSEFMPGMIRSYRGGCSDSSPFPAIYPASALADGAVGPNICRLFQAAVFQAP